MVPEGLGGRPKAKGVIFGLTIFLSAFLLFWVQLLLGKYILPWFGGSPSVWTTCILFFQVGLLAGYTYAHLVTTRLRARTQAKLHAFLLLFGLAVMAWLSVSWSSPITPGPDWKPARNQPVWDIIILLSASVGLPYFTLSSTGPLLQSWFVHNLPSRYPYRLYALSNLGSFLALLSYPFILERVFTLKTQACFWSWAYVCFASACALCAVTVASTRTRALNAPIPAPRDCAAIHENRQTPETKSYALWIGLAACASVIFLATTNQICQDIGVVPLLWVLPLSLYLLSFIVCFEKQQWYSRRLFHPLLGAAVFAACFVLSDGALSSIRIQIGLYSFILFVSCMVCHGELVRSKPLPRYLTSFYLAVAVGGALGGIFVTFVAPHLFKGFWEYHLGLSLCVLFALTLVVTDRESWIYRSRIASPVMVIVAASLLPEAASLTTPQVRKAMTHLPLVTALILVLYVFLNRNRTGNEKARRLAAPVYCGAAWLLMSIILLGNIVAHVRTAVGLSRNFYGVLGIFAADSNDPERAAYLLKHGRILHGLQFRASEKRSVPTTYYGPSSGIGLALTQNPQRLGANTTHRLRIGAVGLGVGTIAAYGKRGDTIRFYEINPEVIRIARGPYFSYLKDSQARVDVVLGDARLSMERELARSEPQNFDVLVIDAFAGDAIPVHLLTEEAFQTYTKELRGPEAIIAIHITNTYLDLRPVVSKLADHLGFYSAWIHSTGGEMESTSSWVLLSRSNALVVDGRVGLSLRSQHLPNTRLWTDDYSNLFALIKK